MYRIASSLSRVFGRSSPRSGPLSDSKGKLSTHVVEESGSPLSLEEQIASYATLKEKYERASNGLQKTPAWRIGKKIFLQSKATRREERLSKAAKQLVNSFKKLGNAHVTFTDNSTTQFAKEDTDFVLNKLNPKQDEDEVFSTSSSTEQIITTSWNDMRTNLDTGIFTVDQTQGISYNNKSQETEERSNPEEKAVTEDKLNSAKTIIGTDPYMQVAIASLMNQNFCFPVNDIERQNDPLQNSIKKYTQAGLPDVYLLSRFPRPKDLENNFTLHLTKEPAATSTPEKFTLCATSLSKQEYTLENGEKFIYERSIEIIKTIQKNPNFKDKDEISEKNSPVLIKCTSGEVTYKFTSAAQSAT